MEWQTKQIRRTYNRLGLGMLAYLLIYQFLSLPLMLVVKLLCPQLLSSSWFGLLLSELVQYAVALPVCWWIAKSANTPQRPLGQRKLSISCFFKYLLLSIGLLFLFNLIGTAVNELLSQIKGSPAGNLIEQSVDSYTLWQMILVTVISAPLGEELLFRKLVYRCVGVYGDKAYVFTSACLFMLMHGNVVQYP
ncbi:MAG: CPBP family intramembrane glutamic endopeptidase, partial [Negativibacillus sp.]